MAKLFVTIVTIVITIVLRTQPLNALGSGAFGNESGVGTQSLAHGYAFAGVADDPSAIYFNPAGLVQSKGLQLMGGGSLLLIDTEHTDTNGGKDTMVHNKPLAPYFYASWSAEQCPWAFGVGVNSPFGLITEWSEGSFSQYHATKSKLLMYVVNPTVAYSINDKISLGFGLDYFNLYNAELNSKIPDVPAAAAPGDAKLTGSGNSWGYNLGLHWKATDRHSFGLSYRSQVNVPVKGNAELRNISGALAALPAPIGFGGTSYNTSATTEFKFPQSVLLGYGFHPNDKWTLFADYEWVNWSSTDKTVFNYDQDNPNLTHTIDRRWHSTNNVGVGAEWKTTPCLDLRFGAFSYEEVIPSDTLESSLPEAGRIGLTFGPGFHFGNVRLDLGYNAIFLNKRHVENGVNGNVFFNADGDYKTFINIFSLGLSYKWGATII